MIRLTDILKESEYAHYRNLRYGLTEQKGEWLMPYDSEYGLKPDYTPDELIRNAEKQHAAAMESPIYKYRHGILLTAEILAAVLIPPPAGLLIAGAIGLTNAALYLQEGDKFMAGLSAIFAIVPGISPAAIKGLKSLSPALTKAAGEFLENGSVKILQKFGAEEAKALKMVRDFLGKTTPEAIEQKLKQRALAGSMKMANATVNQGMTTALGKSAVLKALPAAGQESVRYVANKVLNNVIQRSIRISGGIARLAISYYFYHNLAKLWRYAHDNYVADENEWTPKKEEEFDDLWDEWASTQTTWGNAESGTMLTYQTINTTDLSAESIIELAQDFERWAKYEEKQSDEQEFLDSATPQEKETMLTALQQQQQTDRLGSVKPATTDADLDNELDRLSADAQQVLQKNKVTKNMSDLEIDDFITKLKAATK
jgi:hypothetical protein